MDYGKLLTRAWNIIWEHKFLILLGVLVALGSAGSGENASASLSRSDVGESEFRLLYLPDELGVPSGIVLAAAIAVIGLALAIGIALWAVSTCARGGLIAGASAIDSGAPSSFAQAWSSAWQKGWRLLGIGVLPAIPGFMLALIGLGVAAISWGLYVSRVGLAPRLANIGLVGPLVALACVLLPVAMVLSALRIFANRACMLEDLGVFASYRRGAEVLKENFGPALVLFLLQVVISIGLGIVLLLPNIAMVLCCLLWPVLLLVQGAIASYFSTLWTLAWREWTGLGTAV
ncbi:MAG TPA: hypothetical protein ENL34_01365 [Chloroflexi bacterium]|nr:hypothetical protein [Chloroflexota bacterium]